MSADSKIKEATSDSPIMQIAGAGSVREICLSVSQADLAKVLLGSVNESHAMHVQAQAKWEAFLIGSGMVQGEQIIGGDLDSNDPKKRCLTVQSGNGFSGE
jgi:hypothetical protein|tara:strand:- start:537 stop:839 length:303 start_codon:yes stop_codon:yes gene_type:complete